MVSRLLVQRETLEELEAADELELTFACPLLKDRVEFAESGAPRLPGFRTSFGPEGWGFVAGHQERRGARRLRAARSDDLRDYSRRGLGAR